MDYSRRRRAVDLSTAVVCLLLVASGVILRELGTGPSRHYVAMAAFFSAAGVALVGACLVRRARWVFVTLAVMASLPGYWRISYLRDRIAGESFVVYEFFVFPLLLGVATLAVWMSSGRAPFDEEVRPQSGRGRTRVLL